MSASNWATCPRCWHEAVKAAAKKEAAVMALYGQVPIEEFDRKRAALAEPNREDFQTFREDYGIYDAATGQVEATYEGKCSKCGLSCEFTHSEKFWSPDA